MIMKRIYTIVVSLLVAGQFQQAAAQGCSDAGFCTVPTLKPNSEMIDGYEQPARNRLAMGLSYGQGTDKLKVLTPYLSYDRVITSKLSLSNKITYSSADGGRGSNSGLGDIYTNLILIAHESEDVRAVVSAGAKIPLSDSELSLPMEYQSSLGTVDLILGVAYFRHGFGINFGWQQPLTSEINESAEIEEYRTAQGNYYLTPVQYSRKADLLLRVSYTFESAENRIAVQPSLLAIYHAAEDTAPNRSYSGNFDPDMEIPGSKGMTLNGNLYLIYRISNRHSVELSIGSPFITRDARPDGLTRELVAGLEYRVWF